MRPRSCSIRRALFAAWTIRRSSPPPPAAPRGAYRTDALAFGIASASVGNRQHQHPAGDASRHAARSTNSGCGPTRSGSTATTRRLPYVTRAIIKGMPGGTISAASILAKSARDRELVSLAKTYPEYAFERHKGICDPVASGEDPRVRRLSRAPAQLRSGASHPDRPAVSYSIWLLVHLLGVIVWVGGMFFAHMALRPSAAEVLEPPAAAALAGRHARTLLPLGHHQHPRDPRQRRRDHGAVHRRRRAGWLAHPSP